MAERTLQRLLTRGVDICKKGTRSVHAQAQELGKAECYMKKLEDLPGPAGYPIVGTVPQYFQSANRGQMHEVQRRFHKKHGKMFKEKLGLVTNVSISDPILVEEILRLEGKYPNRPPYESWLLYNQLRGKKGGLMTAYGEHWRKCRTAVSPKFMRPKSVSEFTDGVNNVVSSLVDRLKLVNESTNGGHLPQLPNELYKFTMEALGWILLDARLGCLENEVEEKIKKFIDSIGTMFLTGHQMMAFGNALKLINAKPWREHVQSWDTINSTAQEYIDKKIEQIAKRLEVEDIDENSRTDFLTYLVSQDKLSREEIYNTITEILVAGVDTSANSLSFLLYSLGTNVNTQKLLTEEIDQVLGDRTCTYPDLQKMPYLKAAVKETLRLYPPIPINARILQEDTVIDETLIPKGTCLLLNNYTMSRDDTIFYKPDEFLPERWLNSDAKDWHPFSSIPFGFGARSCVGRRIAELEIYLSTIKILQTFTLKRDTSFDITPSVRTQLVPGPELPLVFEER